MLGHILCVAVVMRRRITLDIGAASLTAVTADLLRHFDGNRSSIMYLVYMDGARSRPDGNNAESEQVGKPLHYPPGPSLKPAMWVLALAAGIFIVGAVALGVFGGSGYAPPAANSEKPAVNGIISIPAAKYLKTIETNGQPPLNVLYALTVPQGTMVQGIVPTPGLPTSYDKAISFISTGSQQQVIDFYARQLPAHHWTVISKGAVGRSLSYEFIARITGTDAQFWELGLTISPTAFASTASRQLPKGMHSAKGYTKYVLRMFPISSEAAS